MTIELDHFFVLTGPGAPQADLLRAAGLIEGTRNNHPGQGTANRRFFFADAMLELLYVRDPHEAADGPPSRLRIVERVLDPSASRFGLIVRGAAQSIEVPFPGWRYHPDYFPSHRYLHVGQNSDLLNEPLCVYMPLDNSLPADQLPPAEPFVHVSELRISVPVVRPSPVLEAIARVERVSMSFGEPHRMEVVFNDEKEGQSRDFRPDLPLMIRW